MSKFIFVILFLVMVIASSCTTTTDTQADNNPQIVKSEKYCDNSVDMGNAEYISKTAFRPPITKWNYEITTSSRIYLAKSCIETNDSVTMNDYFVLKQGCWQLYKGELKLDKKIYGLITVHKGPTREIRFK